MVSITSGKNFTTNEFTEFDDYHDAIDNATVTGLTRADFDSNTSLIHIGASAPSSPSTGEYWFDTTLGLLRYYDGANFEGVAFGVMMTNKSGSTATDGSVVVVDTANDRAYTSTTTSQNELVCGVVAGDTANDAKGIVITHGKYFARVASAVTSDQPLATSTSAFLGDNFTGNPTASTYALAIQDGSTKVRCRLML